MDRPRVKVTPTRVTGRILEWKGKYGWILPDVPISHPEAFLHRGKVYLNQIDVEAEISGVGAAVSFQVYADGSGIGAMNVRPTVTPPVMKSISRALGVSCLLNQGKGKGKFQTTNNRQRAGPRQRVTNDPISGQVASWKGNFGWIQPSEPVSHPLHKGHIFVHKNDIEPPSDHVEVGTQLMFFVYADNQGLGAEHCQVISLDDEEAKEEPLAITTAISTKPVKSNKRVLPKGLKAKPELPRERLSSIPMTGEVLEWKHVFGWISAYAEIHHPLSSKHDGKVYVGLNDLVGVTELKSGQLVEFHVFADSNGLGAEECTLV